jgi:murein DD-endopeptidase MepM/ murein hydrolase activator NlpD
VSLDPKIGAADSTPAATGTVAAAAQASSPDGQKLARLAGEFESMLLVQMLREMRQSGSWKAEDEDKQGFGAETMFDTIDVELASHLQKVQGFGLEKTLVRQIAGTAGAALPASLPLSTTMPPSLSAPLAGEPVASASPLGEPLSTTEHATTSPFGWRRDPFTGATTYHRGVDLRAAYGEPIAAAGDGRVVFAGEQGGYGQTVVVEHGNGLRTRYAHLSAVLTEAGAEVKAGDAVGRAGRTGRATGTHLHFEVTRNGQPVDPQSFSPEGLKLEPVTADWEGGVGPSLPGVLESE